MAEGHVAETPTTEHASFPQQVGRLSDRAIQRLVGGNAFLRGRIYARRNAVSDLTAEPKRASCRVLIRADEPIDVSTELGPEGAILSKCTCQAWRGPTGHCKHVAALLVALRDRERPPKPKTEDVSDSEPPEEGMEMPTSIAPLPRAAAASAHTQNGAAAVSASAAAGAQGVPGTGKRRRSRRRRRGGGGAVGAAPGAAGVPETIVQAPMSTGKIEVLSARQLGLASARRGGATAARDGLDAWLPTGEVTKPC